MKRGFKIGILILLVLAMAGIYFGKNTSDRKDRADSSLEQKLPLSKDLPVMIEFKTDT
jgi:hypothetical protein